MEALADLAAAPARDSVHSIQAVPALPRKALRAETTLLVVTLRLAAAVARAQWVKMPHHQLLVETVAPGFNLISTALRHLERAAAAALLQAREVLLLALEAPAEVEMAEALERLVHLLQLPILAAAAGAAETLTADLERLAQ